MNLLKLRTLKQNFIKFYRNLTPIQLLVGYYAAMIVLTFGLLSLPFFKKTEVSLLDTLFMAVSTISVTGLSTFQIQDVYTEAGVILLEILFQVGAFGVTMLSTAALVVTKKRISLHQRQMLQFDMNQPRLSGLVRLATTVFVMMVGLQIIFGIFFSWYFYIKQTFGTQWSKAIFQGFYTAIAAITNAGFDITGKSLLPFSHDYFFLLIVMFLIILGGIGFPVLTEVLAYFKHKLHPQSTRRFRFSLFSKLAVFFALFFLILGTVLIYISENKGFFAHYNDLDKLMTAMFYSVSTRNAGLQINDMTTFNTTTLLILSLLMFIGASPSSVGGGVRTTTIGIYILYLYSFIRGRNHINIFNRQISREDVQKAIVVVSLSTLLCASAILILSVSEQANLISIIFEVASAFGTTGLSLGLTSQLSVVGKCVIIILMFIGRVGMLYTLLIFVKKQDKDLSYQYPTEKIIIG